jgi:predicted GIY-YIG superfamily endonuclease
MTWYVYILLCADNTLYVGHTHDLQSRFDAHQSARGALHTAKHRPVQLIYSEDHSSEQAAICRERQLKRWSRAKKLALSNGDVGQLRALSKSRESVSF